MIGQNKITRTTWLLNGTLETQVRKSVSRLVSYFLLGARTVNSWKSPAGGGGLCPEFSFVPDGI